MKIFFPLGAFYPSQVGGPCNTLYWHTCELKEKGFEVEVLTTSLGIEEGTVLYDQFLDNVCGRVYYGKREVSTYSMYKVAAESIGKADLIHLNSLFHGLSIFCFLYTAVRFPRKRIIWSVRGELSPEALRFSSWKKSAMLFIYKRLIKNVLFHSTSDQETVDIKKHFRNSRVAQIPNFIRVYQRLDVPKKNKLLFMGRVHPIKGLHKLIEGLALSQRFKESDFVMEIVGNYKGRQYEYYLELKGLVDNLGLDGKVKFSGHIGGEAKQRAYAESYFLILPSETENFGNVVAEALNQGTPVIASTGTPWKVLEEKNCGFHIDNSPEMIAATVDRVVEMDELEYYGFCERSRQLVDENFDVSKRIDVWLDLYSQLYRGQ